MKKGLKKSLIITLSCLFLTVLLALCIIPFIQNGIDNLKASQTEPTYVENINNSVTTEFATEGLGSFRSTAYYSTYNEWKKQYNVVQLDNELAFQITQNTINSNPSITFLPQGGIDGDTAAVIEKNETLN